jgi:hypothetical protein
MGRMDPRNSAFAGPPCPRHDVLRETGPRYPWQTPALRPSRRSTVAVTVTSASSSSSSASSPSCPALVVGVEAAPMPALPLAPPVTLPPSAGLCSPCHPILRGWPGWSRRVGPVRLAGGRSPRSPMIRGRQRLIVALGSPSGWAGADAHSRILRPPRSPATCATCGLHSAQAPIVRDYLE